MSIDTVDRTKRCAQCGETKAYSEYTMRNGLGLPAAYCKPCMSARVSAKQRAQRRADGKRELQNLRTGLPDGMKRCAACAQVLPIEGFPISGKQRRHVCLPCHNAQNAAYKATRREQIKASAAAYRAANREVLPERQRRWREEHPERHRAIAATSKRNNRDMVNSHTHKRRAILAGAEGKWTAAEWRALKAAQDYRCLMCGRREPEITLTVDHIVPPALGGANAIDNIQGLCKGCNSRKHQGIVDLRQHLDASERIAHSATCTCSRHRRE